MWTLGATGWTFCSCVTLRRQTGHEQKPMPRCMRQDNKVSQHIDWVMMICDELGTFGKRERRFRWIHRGRSRDTNFEWS